MASLVKHENRCLGMPNLLLLTENNEKCVGNLSNSWQLGYMPPIFPQSFRLVIFTSANG